MEQEGNRLVRYGPNAERLGTVTRNCPVPAGRRPGYAAGMKPPPFRWFLAPAFVAAGLVAWLPLRLGGVHGYQTPALTLALAWFALFAPGLLLYRRRALGLLLAAPPALFWLYMVGGALACDGGRCG
jgi:hypothetical protein